MRSSDMSLPGGRRVGGGRRGSGRRSGRDPAVSAVLRRGGGPGERPGVPRCPQGDVDRLGPGGNVAGETLGEAVDAGPDDRAEAAWSARGRTGHAATPSSQTMTLTPMRTSPGSRPTAAQCPARAARLPAARRAGRRGGSTRRRARRRAAVRRSPVPPIQMGRSGWTGRARCRPRSTSRARPRPSSPRPGAAPDRPRRLGQQVEPIATSAERDRARRTRRRQPAPSPTSARPPDRWSIVVTALASTPGCR